jgi:hypothetical protein
MNYTQRITQGAVCILFLLLGTSLYAQSYLVTHHFIRDKVNEGYFRQKPGTIIPDDFNTINTRDARDWLYLDEFLLPTDGRMPWWSELLPATEYLSCPGTSFPVCSFAAAEYTTCGTYLYDAGFNANLLSFTRRRMGATNSFWAGREADNEYYCSYTPPLTKAAARMKALQVEVPLNEDTVRGRPSGAKALRSMNALADDDESPVGPLNRCGLWGCAGSGTPNGKWLSVSGMVAIQNAGTYYIGVGGDNFFRVYVDGNLLLSYNTVDGDAFKIWHIVPVTLSAGKHKISVQGKNSSGIAVLGCEVYNNSISQLENASSYEQLKVIFTTRNLSGQMLCLE